MVRADQSHTPSDDAAFEVFAAHEAVAARREALTALIRGKLIPKHADDNRFQRGLHALAATAGNPNQSVDDRLWAIAEVIRVAQVVKRLQPKVPELLAAAFAEPIPPCPCSRMPMRA